MHSTNTQANNFQNAASRISPEETGHGSFKPWAELGAVGMFTGFTWVHRMRVYKMWSLSVNMEKSSRRLPSHLHLTWN